MSIKLPTHEELDTKNAKKYERVLNSWYLLLEKTYEKMVASVLIPNYTKENMDAWWSANKKLLEESSHNIWSAAVNDANSGRLEEASIDGLSNTDKDWLLDGDDGSSYLELFLYDVNNALSLFEHIGVCAVTVAYCYTLQEQKHLFSCKDFV